MKLTASVFVCVLALTRLSVSGLTICRPLSKFRLDCNVCTCGTLGVTYTCTERDCYSKNSPWRRNQNSNSYVFDDNNDFFPDDKPRKTREQSDLDDEIPSVREANSDENFDLEEASHREVREGIPYIRDEIPSSESEEETDDISSDEESEEDDDDFSETKIREAREQSPYEGDADSADNEVDDEKDALEVQKELEDEEARINLDNLMDKIYSRGDSRKGNNYGRVYRDVINK